MGMRRQGRRNGKTGRGEIKRGMVDREWREWRRKRGIEGERGRRKAKGEEWWNRKRTEKKGERGRERIEG
jgi:hypothetical protein